MSSEEIDYRLILNDCGLGIRPASVVVKNIENLDKHYDSTTLTDIYNYCLINITDPEILMGIIKISDTRRNSTTLNILLNMLQLSIKQDNEQQNDELINLRVLCTKAIANYKDTASVKILLDCLNNKKEHYRVRLACADALGRIGDRFAVRPLINLVEDEEEKSVYLKESATFALGILGDTSAIDPLVAILESKHGVLDKFSFLKEKIVEALGKLNINSTKVMKALKSSLMDSSPMVRINAIEAIMNSEEPNAVELIKPSLNDEDDEVKKNALIALYNLIGRDILDEVIDLPIYTNYLKDVAKELINEYEVEDE